MSVTSDFVSAREAAERLDIKRATLYCYVSRGWVRSVADPGHPRRHLYHRGDIERLAARREPADSSAAAAGALRWGEPVLDSAVTAIDARGPLYRGVPAVGLAATRRFEEVAELLWTGALPDALPVWPDAPDPAARGAAGRLPRRATAIERLSAALPALAAGDPERFGAPAAAEHERARRLMHSLVDALEPEAPAAAPGASVAARFLTAAGAGTCDASAVAAIDRALILAADHELNVSTFAARVTASAGADLYACVAAALAALSGPRHGGACDRIEALVDEIGEPRRAAAVIRARTRLGEDIPGFGHPLYPAGDPRTAPLQAELRRARRAGPSPRVAIVEAIARAMKRAGRDEPTLDFGLVAVCAALDLPRGAATALFAVGRLAGWVAHIVEQRDAGYALRPRARYVGPEVAVG